jgi:hypothetical protein
MQDASHRIARGCTEAAIGYATAATAAYTDAASRMLDFWCTALSGLSECSPSHSQPAPSPARATVEPPFGLSLADWVPFPFLDPRRFEAFWRMDPMTPPAVAMMAMANACPLRGTSASWGLARVMIDSGVPRAVAWPAAEASAAALDAADAATQGMTKVLAHFHTDSGFASAARSMTPSVVFAAMMAGAQLPAMPLAPSWMT